MKKDKYQKLADKHRAYIDSKCKLCERNYIPIVLPSQCGGCIELLDDSVIFHNFRRLVKQY